MLGGYAGLAELRAQKRRALAPGVNRLRQVTSAISQDGTNQVNIIKSSADSKAAAELRSAYDEAKRLSGYTTKQVSEVA